MRLDKFLSHSTGMSRVDVRRLIKAKRVSVDDVIRTKSDFAVQEDARVCLDDEVLKLQGPRYIMLYKPAGYVCATTDSDYPTVLDLLQEDSQKLSIAGRLDKDTTGLVLISDDGAWVHRIISPAHECVKVYHAELDAKIDDEIIRRFAEGMLLRSEIKNTLPADLRTLADKRVEVRISEGKYHQVKRMFAACGRHVEQLHRVQIGVVELDPGMAPGDYRHLSESEIAGMAK